MACQAVSEAAEAEGRPDGGRAGGRARAADGAAAGAEPEKHAEKAAQAPTANSPWAPPGDSWASLGIENQVIPGPRNQESRIFRESESRIMSVTGLKTL